MCCDILGAIIFTIGCFFGSICLRSCANTVALPNPETQHDLSYVDVEEYLITGQYLRKLYSVQYVNSFNNY